MPLVVAEKAGDAEALQAFVHKEETRRKFVYTAGKGLYEELMPYVEAYTETPKRDSPEEHESAAGAPARRAPGRSELCLGQSETCESTACNLPPPVDILRLSRRLPGILPHSEAL